MPEHVPDRVDRAIVARLQHDGRMANVDLADGSSLAPSACLRRVKTLEASGIIAGYRAEVSRLRAGLDLTVFIGLKVEGHSQETSSRIEQALLAIPAIVACYLVSGTNDFLVEAAVPALASYEQLLLGPLPRPEVGVRGKLGDQVERAAAGPGVADLGGQFGQCLGAGQADGE